MNMKLFLWISLIVLFSSLVYGIFVVIWLNEAEKTQAIQQLKSECAGLRVTLASDTNPNYDQLAKDLSAASGRRVTFVDKTGVVLADSNVPASALPNHASREEIAQALASGQGSSIRYSQTEQYEEAYYAILIDNGVVLRLSLPLGQVMDTAVRIWSGILIATGVLLVLGILVALGAAARISGPLKQISLTAARIADGDFDARVPGRPKGEIGRLGQALNAMSAKLSTNIHELESEKSRLETLLASMSDGVVAVDSSMHLQFVNTAARMMLDAEGAQKGKHLLETIRNAPLYAILQKALQDKEHVYDEIEAGVANRSILKLSASPIKRGEEISGAVALIQDVSALRRLERIRSDFVANVSHELKTPLTSIQGFTQTLLAEDPDKATQQRFLGIIGTESERLKRLIDDILTLSEIESAVPRVNEPTDLIPCFKSAFELMRPAAESKQVALTLNIPDGRLMALGQRDRVEQMLVNLIDNAIKYTPEKGSIQVSLSHAEGAIIIEVNDTGIGIPTKHLSRIFERFYRVDKGRSRALGGTGLGLAIVKHIALSMNGKVSADSNEGQGSTFRVTIPALN